MLDYNSAIRGLRGGDARPSKSPADAVAAAVGPARRVPESAGLGLAFAIAYLTLFELYSGATYHESAKAASIARDLATLVPYLAPLALFHGATRGVLRSSLVALFLGAHILLDVAFVATHGTLDYAFIRDNIADSTSNAAASMILGMIPAPAAVVAVLEAGLLVWLVLRERGRERTTRGAARVGLVVAALVLVGLSFAGRIPSRDALSQLGNSAYQYYKKNQRMADARARRPAPYPFVHEEPATALPPDMRRAAPGEHPNVVLITLESFSAAYVGKTGPDGAPYTPTLDRLIASGTSAPRFYGNSIQTCHGRFATLCSLAPSYRKKEAYIAPLSLECLPSVLREAGWATAFYEGDESERFENIDEFGARMGFERIESAAPRRLSDEERAHVWGWGLQDDYFYAWALRDVLARRAREPRPFFITLAPVSNHYPFDAEPGAAPLAGEPTRARAAYTSSLRASDRRLARFFELLDQAGLAKDTLVIVTGDHSFPADEHGSHWNERGFYEESFRVPLVMMWPGHLPARALEGAFSQLDLAPTVLDLVGVRREVPFEGRSMLASGARFLPLVQPYDGQYLGAVAWPWKYREHGYTGEARIFNLEADPTESRPLALAEAPREIVTRLQEDVERIHLNQALLQSNQVWPSAR